MKYSDEFRDPRVAEALAEIIRGLPGATRVMEVCGTHTTVISRYQIRAMTSPSVELFSGPGCPVCVTDELDIHRSVQLALKPGVVVATFGDMVRVPGASGSLQDAGAAGARVEVVYSPLDALEIARREPGSRVVFLGVGFETTAPLVAATILQAQRLGLDNFFVLSLHKVVAPALKALVEMDGFSMDGLLLPGHVCAITGTAGLEFLPREHGIPCVVAGFEPLDILQAIRMLKQMQGSRKLEIEYSRAVRPEGNSKALRVMDRVFQRQDARWRALGIIPAGGLALKEEFRDFDAGSWEVPAPPPQGRSACRCADVLCGRITPAECGLFQKDCTPDSPAGPCMVSGEGACAAWYHYGNRGGPDG